MKQEIKNIFLKLGADVCGVANIDRFTNAPKGYHPTDIFTNCKSVIVFAKTLPKGLTQVNPRLIYQHFNSIAPVELDRIAYLASNEIEKTYNRFAVPIPSDEPLEYWDNDKMEARGLLSMKHAAVLAGIGTLGKSTLLINRKYGNMLSIGVVLTDLDLPSDMLEEEICIKGCKLCTVNCPAGAIDEFGVNQKLCRKHTYGTNGRGYPITNCNKCRTICPMRFGQQL